MCNNIFVISHIWNTVNPHFRGNLGGNLAGGQEQNKGRNKGTRIITHQHVKKKIKDKGTADQTNELTLKR